MSNEPVMWTTVKGKEELIPLYAKPVDDTSLLQQALEALVAAGLSAHKTKQVREQAITALRERLGDQHG